MLTFVCGKSGGSGPGGVTKTRFEPGEGVDLSEGKRGFLRVTRPGKLSHNYGKSPFLMGKSTISMAIFNSFLYVYQAG